jgi:GDPmannose 4,6-dehydratase
MTRALVTGITGQDGFYLGRLLLAEGTEVWGLGRSSELPEELAGVHLAPAADLRDFDALRLAVATAQPDEVYHLAADTSVAGSWSDPGASIDVTAAGTARLLEAVRREAPRARVFLASSSEIFGLPDEAPQTEETPLRPVSPYGAAKACAFHLGQMFRQTFDMHVVSGILYNHESPRRPESFVSRKITAAAAAIANGSAGSVALGNLDSRRDWGDAEDTVRAMPLLLRHDTARDWIVATGTLHTVRDWCEIAFGHVGLDWRRHVTVDPAFWRPDSPVPLVGDARALRMMLGWTPQRSFAELVKHMVETDLARQRLGAAV